MKLNFVFIPLIVFAVSFIGSRFTASGMAWYHTIALPDWTPGGKIIGTAWTIIFILSAIATIIIWNTFPRDDRFSWIMGILISNGILNMTWSYLFFHEHGIGAALIEMILLWLSVLAVIFLAATYSKLAAALFVPYALWVAFATFLTLKIYQLNS